MAERTFLRAAATRDVALTRVRRSGRHRATTTLRQEIDVAKLKPHLERRTSLGCALV
jgi:hypothetical protein